MLALSRLTRATVAVCAGALVLVPASAGAATTFGSSLDHTPANAG